MSQTTRDIIKTYFQTNDRPTQQQFYDWLESVVWYDEVPGYGVKEYVALISEDAGQPPVAVVLVNTLPDTISFTYEGVGDYVLMALNGIPLFTENKTTIEFGALWNSGDATKPAFVSAKRESATQIFMRTFNFSGDMTDGMLLSTHVRITVYP